MADPVSIGLTVALTALQMGVAASRKIEGPRLQDTKIAGGDYGTPRQRIWATKWGPKTTIFAEELKEVERRRKTKGGKYNDFTHFATWSAELASHPISAVRRVKFDGHLVLDLSGAGPVTPFDFGEGGSFENYIKIWPGDENQEPGARMEATVDALHGEGSCPAYRGAPRIDFEGVPVEKFGNRIPQVSVEISSGVGYPFTTTALGVPQANRLWNATFSSDFAMFMWESGGEFAIWDVAAQTMMATGALDRSINAGSRLGLKSDGDFYAISAGNDTLLNFAPTGGSSEVVALASDQNEVRVILDGNGDQHWMTIPWSVLSDFYFDGALFSMGDLSGASWAPYSYVLDDEGCIWAAGWVPNTAATTAHFYRILSIFGATGPDYFTVTGLPAQSSGFMDCDVLFHDGAFVLCWKTQDLYRIEKGTGTILASNIGLSLDTYNTSKQFANYMTGSGTLWLNSSEYDLPDLTVIRTIDVTLWKVEDADGMIYNRINHSLYCFPQYDQILTERFLDRVGDEGVTLATIVSDTFELAGVPASAIDVTQLTQNVRGYGVDLGSGKDWLGALLNLHDVDARPHGFQLEFVPRGGAITDIRSSEDFVAPANDDEPHYRSARQGGTDVPQTVVLKYANFDAEQQPATAKSGPLAHATGRRELILDMGNLVLTPGEAQQMVARYHRRLAFGRVPYALALPGSAIALEPADGEVLDLNGNQVPARLETMVLGADGRIDTEWQREDPSAADLNGAAGTPSDGHIAQTIAVPLLSKGFVLDIPLLDDSHEETNPVAYFAASSWAAGAWPGAVFYSSLAGEYTEEQTSVTSYQRAAWGYATTILPDGLTSVWDEGNSVNVKLQVGSLTGTTQEIVDQSPAANIAILGDELINFTTATLEADGSYTLTGLKRGRRGTDWATGTHAARDVFLLLDTAGPEVIALSDVGTDLSYKAITHGRSEAGAFPVDLTPFAGVSKKPYSPVHLDGMRDVSSGDWALSWVRRSRIGSSWTSGTSMPLGEDSEEYEVEIMSGSSVVRTITGLSSPSYTYTSAMQVTDFGADQLSLTFRIYQISAQVGRGQLAELTAIGGDDGSVIHIGGRAVAGETTISLTGLSGGGGAKPVEDDLVVLAYAIGATSDEDVQIISAGWTEITELYANDESRDTNLAVFYKKMGAVPDTSVIVGGTGSGGHGGAVAMQVWRNVDISTPLDVAAVTATGINTGIPNPPAITPGTAGAVILAIGAGAAFFGSGTDYTSGLDNFITDVDVGPTTEAMIGMGSYDWTSGAYDPAAFGGGTASTNSSWCAVTLALRPKS